MKIILKYALLASALVTLLIMAAGCGGGGQPSGPAPTTAPPAGATQPPAVDPAVAATINGKVNFSSAPPQPKKISMESEPNCAKQFTEGPFAENVLVKSGALQNVFVYVKEGLGGKTFPTPQQPALLDQQGCRYLPHVFGMQANQPLLIRNSDDNLHNIHPRPKVNKEFNQSQPRKGQETTKTFEKPEVMIPLFCEIHSWMSGYIGVLEHPFYAVSGADGAFSIKGLPPGDFTIEAWHEEYGTQTQKVTVAAKDAKQIEFTFKAP